MNNQDLSACHHPVGSDFAYPDEAGKWSQYALSAEQVAHYHDQGFVSGIKLLSDAQVDLLRGELEAFFQPDHAGRELWYEYHTNEASEPDRVLFHALGSWRMRPGFHDALWNPAFTLAASQLLGGAVRFWHDQLFCKPAHHGGVVAWHQDYSYWTRTRPMQHLTCWIGLDDTDQSNGCMFYVPGSHQWDLLPITGLAGDMDAIEQVLTPHQWEALQNPVPVCLKKGHAAFHHPLMVHGSRENRSDRPRRALVLNAFKDGTLSDTDEPLMAGVPVVPKGEKLAGRFFPLLLDPTNLPVSP